MRKILSLLTAVLFAGSMMAATFAPKALADITADDVVIVTMQNAEGVYAMSNDNGTAKAPAAVAVTVADGKISTEATNILWQVVKDGDNLSFKTGDNYLYCTNTNNGVRVGANAGTFIISSDYLCCTSTSSNRYIGIYNSADWRCYTTINSNITGQTLVFYAQEASQGGGETPQPTTRTIYLNGGGENLWNQAGAVFFVHAWGGTEADVLMTQVEGDVYSATIPSDNTSLLFVRMAPGSEAINWDTKWNQSADQTIPADKDLFTMTDWSNGTWSVYGETPEPPAPVEVAYYLVGTMNNWTAAEAYKFAAAETEGEYLLHTTLAVDDEVKVIKVEGETTTWYPAEGGNYVVDAAHAGEKDIYFRPAGNEAWADFGGYIWMGENQPAPVADFTQPFTLKFNGTGEASKDASAAFTADVAAIFDAASAPYVVSVETATKIYAGRPISDDNSSVKFGTTSAQGSLAFTLAQAIEVDSIIVNATQYGNNAAKVTVNGTEFDLTAGNKKPQDCKITPEGEVSSITIAQSGTERIYLRNVRVYPKQGGVDPQPVVKYYIIGGEDIVGEGKYDWNLENALPSYDREYVLNLAAGFHKFKVVTIDSQWKGIEALTDTAAGIYTDVDGNICFDLAEAGAVTVVYDENEFTVSGNFAIVQHPQFYVVGGEDIVGPGHATWNKEGGLVSYGDTLEMNLAAGEHLLKVVTPTDAWLGFEALTDTAAGLYPVDDLFGGWNIGFTLEEAAVVKVIYNGEIYKLIGDFYVAPVEEPAKFYITGNAALVGQDKEWNPAAIPSKEDSKVLSLEAGSYMMKITTNGAWEGENNVKGYDALTGEIPAGISRGENENNDNICFMLAEAGDVTVTYTAESFTIAGNFYVAPVVIPAKFYLTGDSALVVDAGLEANKAWAPAAIKVETDTMTLNLKAKQAYMLKITLDGEWATGRGYSSLSEKPEGITTDADDNIIFTLVENGAVNVIYVATEDTTIFKVEGNFYVAPAPDPTVAVMGTMNNWAEEIPFVLSDDKTYASLTVEHISADNYEFKFIVNGEWRSNGYTYHRGFPGAAGITENNDQNMIFQADVDGEYTFYWYFANDSAAIVYPELPFACDWDNIEFLGDGSPEQTHGSQYKLCKEGEYPGVVNVQKPGFAKESGIYVTFPSAAFGEISLQEDMYAIQGAGMILYCSAFDAQQETEVTVVCDNNPIVFTVYNANYTPAPPTGNIRLVPGVWNLANAKFAAVTWHVGEAFENGTVSAWFEYLNADTLIGNVPNDADSIAFARFSSAAEVPSMDMSMIWNHTDKLLIDKQTMIYTISGWPEEGRDFCPGYWGEYVAPIYNFENGYYLMGSFNNWAIDAANMFEANPESEGEYVLAINLAENDEVKVAYVENDQAVYWYPKGDNYTVDQNHAGPTTMYFRPDYFDDWNAFGGYFYIVPVDHVGVDNVDAAQQAVKMLREGQIMIIRGEHIYTPMGQMIK